MLRKILLLGAGLLLTLLGLAGLVLPLVPGLLLLAAAAGCFSLASPRFHDELTRRLSRYPRYRAATRRWHAARGLRPADRLKLALWLALEGASAWVPRPFRTRREHLT